MKSIPIVKELSFDQPDEYLTNLGLSFGSAIINNLMLLMIFLVLGFIHLILCLVRNKEHKCRFVIVKIYQLLTFTLYIRIAIEVYMFTNLMIISEIKYYIKNEGGKNFGHKNVDEVNQVRGNYVSTTLS